MFNLVASLFVVAMIVVAHSAVAQDVPADVILKQGQSLVSLSEALSQIRPGTVVVLGEQHGTLEQASQQLQIIENIKKNGHIVSVGFEFLKLNIKIWSIVGEGLKFLKMIF
jgi:uncharacterized iron-regulated protein